MADCIYNFSKIYQPKKMFKSGQIYRKDADCSENNFLIPDFFCTTFSLWEIIDYVYGRFWCMPQSMSFCKQKIWSDFCEPESDANQWG